MDGTHLHSRVPDAEKGLASLLATGTCRI